MNSTIYALGIAAVLLSVALLYLLFFFIPAEKRKMKEKMQREQIEQLGLKKLELAVGGE